MFPHRHPLAAALTAALIATLGAVALTAAARQAAPAAPIPPAAPALPAASAVPAAPPAQEITAVTVFGKLKKKPSATVRRLDSSRASSCAFFGSSTSHADDMMDAYFDHFQGRDRSTGDAAGTGVALDEMGNDDGSNIAFRDSSPSGDAATSGIASSLGPGTDGVEAAADPMAAAVKCGRTDRQAAAGRNYIARKDKTLDQAFAAYDAGDYEKAMLNFKANYSKLGDDEAALMLGNMYLYGQGAKADTREAIAWYGKLAEARLSKEHNSVFDPLQPERAPARVEAQLKLARIYMTGYDVKADPAKARALYRDAAGLNHVPAQYGLARMLESGYGGAKDPQAAAKLYEDAAEHGYAPAQTALANLYWRGVGKAEDKRAAFAWYQQAAFNPRPDSKKPHAQYALAEMYDRGIGTAADPAKALAFYKLAAVAGHPAAQNALATYFYTGQIVKQDLALARKLFLTAATQASSDAMVNLAAMLYQGQGGDKDVTQAYVWLRLASRMGHAQAGASATALEKTLSTDQRAKAAAMLAPAPKK